MAVFSCTLSVSVAHLASRSRTLCDSATRVPCEPLFALAYFLVPVRGAADDAAAGSVVLSPIAQDTEKYSFFRRRYEKAINMLLIYANMYRGLIVFTIDYCGSYFV